MTSLLVHFTIKVEFEWCRMKLNLNLQSFYSYSNLLQNHLMPNGTFHKSDVGHLYSSLTSNIILEVEIHIFMENL